MAAVPVSAQEEEECGIDGEITLTVREEGIHIMWPEQHSVIVHYVYRSEAGGDFEEVASVPNFENEYLDTNVTAGGTYTYKVEVKFDTTGPGVGRSTFCDTPTATAIPVFPGIAGVAVASVAGIAGYAFMRRR